MYATLRAEMIRRNITAKDIAEKLGKSPSAISAKMTGRANFSFDEVSAIKNEILFSNMPLEELFEK